MFRNINKQKLALTGFLLATSGLSLSSLPTVNMVGISSLASTSDAGDVQIQQDADSAAAPKATEDSGPIYASGCDLKRSIFAGADEMNCGLIARSISQHDKCVTVQWYAHAKLGNFTIRQKDGSTPTQNLWKVEIGPRDKNGKIIAKNYTFVAKSSWESINDEVRKMVSASQVLQSNDKTCKVTTMSDADAKDYFDSTLKADLEKQIQSDDPAEQQKALDQLKKLDRSKSPYVKDMAHLMETYVDADHQIDDAQKYIDSLTDPNQKMIAQDYLNKVKAQVNQKFADSGLKFPEPTQTLEDQIKALAAAYQAQLDGDLNDLAKNHGLSTDPRNTGFRGVPYGGTMQNGGAPVELMQGQIFNGPTNTQSVNTGGSASFTPATNGGGRGNWSGGSMPSAGSPVK